MGRPSGSEFGCVAGTRRPLERGQVVVGDAFLDQPSNRRTHARKEGGGPRCRIDTERHTRVVTAYDEGLLPPFRVALEGAVCESKSVGFILYPHDPAGGDDGEPG